jgi:hypothetical protein
MLISFRVALIMENVVSEGVEVRSVDVGPHLKEVLSIDVEPDLKGNEHLDRRLQENFVLKQAVNLWQGPKNPATCSLAERIIYFESCKWSATKP